MASPASQVAELAVDRFLAVDLEGAATGGADSARLSAPAGSRDRAPGA